MKFNKVLTLILISLIIEISLQSFLKSQDSTLKETVIVINFYDKSYNDNSSLSCKIKFDYESKSCTVNKNTVTAGKLIFKLAEKAGEQAEEHAAKEAAKNGPTLASQMSIANTPDPKKRETEEDSTSESFTDGVKNGLKRAGEAVKDALVRIGHAFRFRFAVLSDKSQLNTKEDFTMNGSSELDRGKGKLKKKNKKGRRQDDPDSGKQDKAERCNNRISRLALSGSLDTRYIQDCNVKLLGNPAGGFSVKFTAKSRETEETMLKLVELVIPKSNSVNQETLDSLIKKITESCKATSTNIKKIINDLEQLYCSKKLGKNLIKCDQLEEGAWKTKCNNIQQDITDAKAEIDKLSSSVEETRKTLDDCYKKKLLNESEADILNKKAKTEEQKKKAISSAMTDTQSNLNKAKTENEKANADVIASKKNRDEADKASKNLDKEMKTGNDILNAKNAENKSSGVSKNEIQKQIADIDSKITTLRAEEKKAHAQHGSYSKKGNDAKKRNDEATEKNQNANDDTTTVETNIRDLENDIQVASTKLNELQKQKKDSATAKDQKAGASNADTADEQTEILNNTNTICEKIYKEIPQPIKAEVQNACKSAAKGENAASDVINKIVQNFTQ